jgi:hypothetical protein
MNKTAALNKLAVAVTEYIKAEQQYKKVAAAVNEYGMKKQAQVGKTISNVLLGTPWMHGANTSKIDAIAHMLGGAKPQSSFWQDREMANRLLGGLLGGTLGAGAGAGAGVGASIGKDMMGGDGLPFAAAGLPIGALLGTMLGSRGFGALHGLGAKITKELGAEAKDTILAHPLYSGFLQAKDPELRQASLGSMLAGNLLSPMSIPFSPLTNQVAVPINQLVSAVEAGIGKHIPR